MNSKSKITIEQFMNAAFEGNILTVQNNIQLLSSRYNCSYLEANSFLANLLDKGHQDIFNLCLNQIKPSTSELNDLLTVAIKLNNLDIVQLLLDNGAQASISDLLSVLKSNAQIALLILNSKTASFYRIPNSVLDYPIVQQTPELCQILVNKFKVKTDKYFFIRSLDNEQYKFFSALLSTDEARNLYKIILDNELRKARDFLRMNNNTISTLEMEMCLLLCAKQKKFSLAEIIYSEGLANRVEYTTFSLPTEPQPFTASKWADAENMLGCKREAIRKALNDIHSLLLDGNQCIPLLEELDNQIAVHQKRLGVDFSTIQPQDYVSRYGMRWPKAPADYSSIKSYSLLRVLLRDAFKARGVETSDEMTTFCGLVPPKVANWLLSKGGLFKEHHLAGNILFHGLFSHYLQMYIILRAIETGKIKTDYIKYLNNKDYVMANLSLDELLAAFIYSWDSKPMERISFWDSVLDGLSEEGKVNMMDFTYPEIVNQALFWVDSLPHLRGYLLNDWFRKTDHYLNEANQQNTEHLSFETLITLSAIATYFDSFNPFQENTLENYYASRPNSHFNKVTGVSTKSWETRCQFWRQPSAESEAMEVNTSNSPLNLDS